MSGIDEDEEDAGGSGEIRPDGPGDVESVLLLQFSCACSFLKA